MLSMREGSTIDLAGAFGATPARKGKAALLGQGNAASLGAHFQKGARRDEKSSTETSPFRACFGPAHYNGLCRNRLRGGCASAALGPELCLDRIDFAAAQFRNRAIVPALGR
jgi:hypothetical protein